MNPDNLTVPEASQDRDACSITEFPQIAPKALLCQQCREDVPKLWLNLQDAPPSKPEDILTRSWLKGRAVHPCDLCLLFAGRRLEKKLKSGCIAGTVTVRVCRTSFLKASGEIQTASALPTYGHLDFTCLQSRWSEKSGLWNQGSVITPYSRAPEKQADASYSSRGYAARLVNLENYDHDLVISWIAGCQLTHGDRCNGSFWDDDFPESPSHFIQLIDCHDRQVVEATIKHEYLTLSYVWGSQHAQLPAIKKYQGISKLPKTLPRTIEDAMTVTIQLGYRYLWCDQCCIDQRDETNKSAQIALMGKIYRASQLTIVAAAGQDAEHGLPRVKNIGMRAQAYCSVDKNLTLVSCLDRPHKHIEKSVWNTRGWTFQEGMLARRRLVFTEEQVYFECQCTSIWESLRRPLAKITSETTGQIEPEFSVGFFQGGCGASAYHRHGSVTDSYATLTASITAFLKRRLTYENDTLNAFEGFVRALYPNGAAYGLPLLCSEQELQTASQFKVDGTDDRVRVSLSRALAWTQATGAKQRLGIPSFSWAGWTLEPRDIGTYLKETHIVSPEAVQFPGLSWTQLLTGPPSVLRLRGLTSRLILSDCGHFTHYANQSSWLSTRSKGARLKFQVFGSFAKNEFQKSRRDEMLLGLDILIIGISRFRMFCLIIKRIPGGAMRIGTLETGGLPFRSTGERLSTFVSTLERPLEWETIMLS